MGSCLVAKSCPTLGIPWTVPLQTPLAMECSRQEYWSGLPLSFPEDLPHPGIKHASPASAGEFFTTGPPGKPFQAHSMILNLGCTLESP